MLFLSPIINRRPGHDGLSFNLTKKCFGQLCEPLRNLFNLKGIFPDGPEISRVIPI